MSALWRFWFLAVCLVLLLACSSAPSPPAAGDLPSAGDYLLQGDVQGVHDPSMAKEGSAYYVFSTDTQQVGHLPIRCSTDLQRWTMCGHMFDVIPAWIQQAMPDTTGLWAPDVSYFSGKFHVYYAASTFGKNRSIIALATNSTLDPTSKDYQWVDEGKVIESFPQDDWNAIDPNIVIDEKAQMWMAFGSFWSGIKMRRVDPLTGKLSTQDTTLYSLASRSPDPPIYGAIEAPFVFHYGDGYYLFVSFDFCCRGANSTYKIMAGRSPQVTGAYSDKNGTPMLNGGGTLILQSGGRWRGPGGQFVFHDGSGDILVYHAYDATTGEPFLQISRLEWQEGWPQVAPRP